MVLLGDAQDAALWRGQRRVFRVETRSLNVLTKKYKLCILVQYLEIIVRDGERIGSMTHPATLSILKKVPHPTRKGKIILSP